uniref:Cyclin n=1 Tax=Noctiluca scintillans TaxID=2966 RepID=A0A6T9AUW3_NOCSC
MVRPFCFGTLVRIRAVMELDAEQDLLDEAEPAGESFVGALATVLTHLASVAGKPQRATRFHSVRPPQMSIHEYLARISKYFQCSSECFVLCLVYIDRIVKLHPEFTICSLNIHRLLVTAVMLAVKFFDDVYYSNAYYAKVGGVKLKEVNTLEAQFLQLIDWRLHVTPQEYSQYRNHVFTAVHGGVTSGAVSALPAEMDADGEGDVPMDLLEDA